MKEGLTMTTGYSLLLTVVTAAVVAQPAWAQDASTGSAQAFPARPIRMLVPFAPGGNTDILARAVSPKMNESFGKTVVVDHRPGGSGVIATWVLMSNVETQSRWPHVAHLSARR